MKDPEKPSDTIKKTNAQGFVAQIYLTMITCAVVLLILSYISELIFSDKNAISSTLEGLGGLINKCAFMSLPVGIALAKGVTAGLPASIVGALINIQGITFSNIGGSVTGISGIFGSIFAGYISIFSVKLCRKIINNKNINTNLITNILSILITSVAVLSINSLSDITNSLSISVLKKLADSKAFLLPLIIGMFTVLDGGGPLFLCAYIFGNTSIVAQQPQIMAAVIGAGMIPSLSAALYSYIHKERLESHECAGAYLGIFPALFGLPQVSYLFYFTRKLRFIIPCAIGSSITSAVSVMLDCTCTASQKGFLNISSFNKPLYLILCIILGVLVSTALMSITIKETKSEDTERLEKSNTTIKNTSKA